MKKITKSKAKENLRNLLKPDVFVTKIVFPNGDCNWPSNGVVYSYLSSFKSMKGTHVVVNAPSSGYTVVNVVEDSLIADLLVHKATKWVVCNVDTSEYLKRAEKEKRIETLKSSIQKMKNEIDSREIMEFYAKKNKSFKALLEELDSLGGL